MRIIRNCHEEGHIFYSIVHQQPEITIREWTVGNWELAEERLCFLAKFTEISKNKAVFWFPFSLDTISFGEPSTSLGKESANTRINEIGIKASSFRCFSKMQK